MENAYPKKRLKASEKEIRSGNRHNKEAACRGGQIRAENETVK
jgi:hypothetical protein